MDWHGIAYNISTNGIGVALPTPMAPGSVLVIEPWGLREASRLKARVVRVCPVSFRWFCGCVLEQPLADGHLEAWIAGTCEASGDLPGFAL
jgi:hypothetical protein